MLTSDVFRVGIIVNIFWVFIALFLNNRWYKYSLKLNDEWAEICERLCSESEIEDYYTKGFDDGVLWVLEKIDELPTIEPQQICEYWDSESKFCALCRPSAQSHNI